MKYSFDFPVLQTQIPLQNFVSFLYQMYAADRSRIIGLEKGSDPFSNFTQNLLSVAELNTNAVSYTYMRLAAQGNISDMLQNAIISAAASDMPTMLENFNRLSDWGATSGIDIAFGAVLGLSAAAGL